VDFLAAAAAAAGTGLVQGVRFFLQFGGARGVMLIKCAPVSAYSRSGFFSINNLLEDIFSDSYHSHAHILCRSDKHICKSYL
jgi:hypothetical protein